MFQWPLIISFSRYFNGPIQPVLSSGTINLTLSFQSNLICNCNYRSRFGSSKPPNKRGFLIQNKSVINYLPRYTGHLLYSYCRYWVFSSGTYVTKQGHIIPLETTTLGTISELYLKTKCCGNINIYFRLHLNYFQVHDLAQR